MTASTGISTGNGDVTPKERGNLITGKDEASRGVSVNCLKTGLIALLIAKSKRAKLADFFL